MTEIHGIIAPVLTPMNDDETINTEELQRQISRLIHAGVHGIFMFGTNGEGYILKEEEKESILELAVKEAAGRVPVYAGTGCVGTKDTIAFSQKAQEAGADVLSVITPWFAAASQDELYLHYRQIAKAVDIPVIIYHIPARTGNTITPATVARLAEIDNIKGIKDSSGNFDLMLQYLEVTNRQNFSVLSGNDSLILWNLEAGGKGAISGCANVFPRLIVQIYDDFMAGRKQEAMEKQNKIRAFRNCFKLGNPNTIVKTAVSLLGYPVGKCRAPFCELSEESIKEIKRVLQWYQDQEIC